MPERGRLRKTRPSSGGGGERVDPLQFVEAQVEILSSPFDKLDSNAYSFEDEEGGDQLPSVQQEILDKAVKSLNQDLHDSRARKHNKAAIDAVVEQVLQLGRQEKAKMRARLAAGLDGGEGSGEEGESAVGRTKRQVRVDEDGRVRLDGQYWLDELPEEWPEMVAEGDERDQTDRGQVDTASLDEYRTLLENVKQLSTRHRILSQQTEHYAKLQSLLSSTAKSKDGLDTKALAAALRSKT